MRGKNFSAVIIGVMAILTLTACSLTGSNGTKVAATVTPAVTFSPTVTPTPSPTYTPTPTPTPVPIGNVAAMSFYKDSAKEELYRKHAEEYPARWVAGEDIIRAYVLPNEAATVQKDNPFSDIWEKAWKNVNADEDYRVCFRLTFTTTDGETHDRGRSGACLL